ncbi:unnamed protein product, partial [Symbiodinium natans]
VHVQQNTKLADVVQRRKVGVHRGDRSSSSAADAAGNVRTRGRELPRRGGSFKGQKYKRQFERSIHRFGRSTRVLIPKAAFKKAVRSLGLLGGLKMKPDAWEKLQLAAEDEVARFMRCLTSIAGSSGRVTPDDRDVEAFRSLQAEQQADCQLNLRLRARTSSTSSVRKRRAHVTWHRWSDDEDEVDPRPKIETIKVPVKAKNEEAKLPITNYVKTEPKQTKLLFAVVKTEPKPSEKQAAGSPSKKRKNGDDEAEPECLSSTRQKPKRER